MPIIFLRFLIFDVGRFSNRSKVRPSQPDHNRLSGIKSVDDIAEQNIWISARNHERAKLGSMASGLHQIESRLSYIALALDKSESLNLARVRYSKGPQGLDHLSQLEARIAIPAAWPVPKLSLIEAPQGLQSGPVEVVFREIVGGSVSPAL